MSDFVTEFKKNYRNGWEYAVYTPTPHIYELIERMEKAESENKELEAFKTWAIEQIQGWQDSYDGFSDDAEMIIRAFEERCQDCGKRNGNYMTPSGDGYYRRCYSCENKAK